LSNAEDFRATVRHGVRIGRPTVVVHAHSSGLDGVRVGFVVSKAIGNAVTRNSVKRRLRHLAADRLATTPAGTDLVVRALPRAASAPADVRVDLPNAWTSVLNRLAKRPVQRGGFT
jgi:ribonuclease P protein component